MDVTVLYQLTVNVTQNVKNVQHYLQIANLAIFHSWSKIKNVSIFAQFCITNTIRRLVFLVILTAKFVRELIITIV